MHPGSSSRREAPGYSGAEVSIEIHIFITPLSACYLNLRAQRSFSYLSGVVFIFV